MVARYSGGMKEPERFGGPWPPFFSVESPLYVSALGAKIYILSPTASGQSIINLPTVQGNTSGQRLAGF